MVMGPAIDMSLVAVLNEDSTMVLFSE